MTIAANPKWNSSSATNARRNCNTKTAHTAVPNAALTIVFGAIIIDI